MAGTPYLISGNSAASGGSDVLTLDVAANVGNTDVVYVGVLVTVNTVTPTVTDSQNNAYTEILHDITETSEELYIFQATGVNPLTTAADDYITITYSANTSAQAAVAVGDNNVSGSDKAIIAHGSGTAVSTGSSGTLSQTEEHAIVFICNAYTGGDPTYASPWSAEVLAVQGAGTTAILSAAYQDVTATTALTGSATITSAAWTAALITDEVNFPALAITPSDGVENEAYSQTLSATGGISPYTFSIGSGSLPTGLSLSGGVISGTPTASGTFTFTIGVDDAHSVITTSSTLTITILPSGASGVESLHMPGQILTAADQDVEDSIGSWAADVNAGTPTTSTETSLTGSYSLKWSATAAGETSIHTGYYTVTPGKPYVVSGYILPCGQRDTQIGIEWYTSGGSLIEQDLGTDNPSSSIAWQPLAFAGTAPSNAAKCKIVYLVQEANAGDVTHIDTTYFAQSGAQVLIDWTNPTFAAGSAAGQDFMDVTPWVRMDQGINLQRGRQDAISEITAGTATFQLQNDTGLFTRYLDNTLIGAIGGDQTLQRRCQVNLTDETGAWWTRYDGPLAEIDYSGDNTGNTNLALITATDILAELSRQDVLECWTKELVLSDGPALHWTLDDAGNSGGFGVAAESSGNNGPPMRLISTATGANYAAIGWQDTGGGVETLADAVAPDEDDGSEFWSPGIVQPNSQLRGLDSGAVGPYTTPLASVFLTPNLTAETGPNYYVGNRGYQFQTLLPFIIAPTAVGSDYSFEIWFTEAAAGDDSNTNDNGIFGSVAADFGPYTLFSLANSRSGMTLVLTVAPAINHLTFQAWLYSQPPGFIGSNFSGSAPPTYIGQVATELSGDKVRLPHHAVVTITGDPSEPTVVAYLDGALFSDEFTSTTLPPGSVFDTITCGGAYGGTGCYWGNLQLLSIYTSLLSGQQIINHAQMGQYGMWEEATDNCVAQLGVFANIPSFWNNLDGASNGLTLTEYQDITGSNPLTNMQLYEQAEMGLLFTDALGRLNFHTRDWRMGHGAPDLYLPPDTFDADMGYETIDQFQINEQAVSTQTYQTGAAYVNSDSQDKYGPYATDGIGSPVQLPLITWSRAYSQLGLSSYYYWSDPYLEDYCSWIANSKAEPWLVPGQLTIDTLTLSKESTGIGISDLYALEIDSMVAPSGTLPASFPDVNLSTEWFIEGINEIYSTSQRQWQAYCSPGEPQRAWKPGDATYGVLGSTTRIGVSAPDTNAPVADGKDVSHDAGGPYWAPTFTTSETLNDQSAFSTGSATEWNCYDGTLSTDDGTLYPGGPAAYSMVGSGTDFAVEQSGSGGPAAVTPGQIISVGGWLYSPADNSVAVGVDFQDASHGYVSTATGSVVSLDAGVWAYVSYASIEVPGSGVSYAYARANSNDASSVLAVQDLTIVPGMLNPADMNNPAQTGNGFVGAVDIRGLTENLSLMLNPPMCVVGATGKTQSQGSGSNSTPGIYWDNIYVDTAQGMGLVPGWPNWYTVTVPGFYDIDGCLVWNGVTGAGQAAQGFIIVAMEAAQAVAAGTATPNTVDQYVCPIGEQAFVNAHSWQVINSPTTRLYLGVGDMVTIGAEQATGSSLATATNFGGSKMSLLFRGYAQYDDRQLINSSITGGTTSSGSGGGSGGTPTKTTHTKTYKNKATYSYYGSAIGYQRKNTNGSCYQGTYSGGSGVTGSETSLILMPYSTIQSDISGATIKSIKLTCTNEHTWYDSGGDIMLGWSTRGNGPSTCKLGSGDHPNIYRAAFSEGHGKTLTLPVSSFGGPLANLGCFLLGNQSTTNLDYYGFWKGGANSWTLTVVYEK